MGRSYYSPLKGGKAAGARIWSLKFNYSPSLKEFENTSPN